MKKTQNLGLFLREPKDRISIITGADGSFNKNMELLDDNVNQLKGDKADKTAIAKTNRSLHYLWQKSKGILYDTEIVDGSGSEITVPSGAMEYASINMLGGMCTNDGDGNRIDASVDKIVVSGKNLFPTPIVKISGDDAIWSVENDKIIGTGSNYRIGTFVGPKLAIGSYVLSAYVKTNSKVFYTIDKSGQKSIERSGIISVGVTLNNNCTVKLQIWGSSTDSEIEFSNLQIEKGNVETSYVPYRAPVEKMIPHALMDACPDYGIGVNAEYYNWIDFRGKEYHHMATIIDGAAVAIAEEIIDIADVIPEDFEILHVEDGGTILLHYPELDNGNEIAVPSQVEFMVDVAEVL